MSTMKNWRRVASTIFILGAFAMATSTNLAFAKDHLDPKKLLKLIQEQQKQLDKLRKALEETQAAQAVASGSLKSDGLSGIISENKLKIGGVVEIEATNTKSFRLTNPFKR